MFSPPPKDARPGDLFRLVVRGEAPLSYRVSAAPCLPLRVRAPSSLLTAEAHALALSGAQADLQALVLSSVLLTPSGPAFASPEQTGLLPEHDAVGLWADVWKVLTRMAPMVALHYREWRDVLKKGADANPQIAMSMGRCADLGRYVVPRPDRYYGKPIGELSDAQYLAVRVCIDSFVEGLK